MRIATGFLALSLVSQTIFAANPDVPNFLSDVARTIDYVEKSQDAVWPGFRMADMPIVIDMLNEVTVDNLYAFNLVKKQLPWHEMKFGDTSVLFLKNRIKDDLYQFSGQVVVIDSQPSFISSQFEEDIPRDRNFMDYLTVEKATYYLQHQSKVSKVHLNSLGIDYSGFYDIDNLKLTYLENAALSTYLSAKGALREQALKDAAAIDRIREVSIVPTEFQYFQHANEIFFGIPAFISMQSKNLGENDYIFKAHQVGCKPLNAKAGFDALQSCDLLNGPSFRSVVFGHALSEKLSSYAWKTAAETEYKTLGDIVQEYYQINEDQAATLTAAAKQNPAYNYQHISTVIDDVLNNYVNSMNAALKDYEKGSGVELYSPWVILDMFNSIDSLDPKVKIFPITINKTLRLDADGDGELDNFVSIEFKHLPYAINQFKYKENHEIDNENSWTIFKLLPASMLTIDGQKISVADFTQSKSVRKFASLNIKDARVKLNVITSGKLDASDGSLKLLIDNIYAANSNQVKIRK